MRISSVLVLLTVVAVMSSLSWTNSAQAKVVYVAHDASGTGSGENWDNACTSISSGLVKSASGDDIWVKTGRYLEAINMEDFVSIYGGFSGNETSFATRDWVAHETIIDATGLEDRSTVTAAGGATLDGFTVTGSQNQYNGGGVTTGFHNILELTLANCTITGNKARYGGGIFCYSYNSIILTNCVISSNIATAYGGGIYCDDNSHLSVTNCNLVGNNGGAGGGGLCCGSESTQVLTESTVSDNSANQGGGLQCVRTSTTVTDCTITGNSAYSDGGGLYSESGSTTLTNCMIKQNTTSEKRNTAGGGGICSRGDTLTLSNCTIEGNSSQGSGGGLRCDSDSLSLASCGIMDNSAEYEGGGVYCSNSDPMLTNCTIANNKANGRFARGGGAHFFQGTPTGTPTLDNCIIAGNNSALYGGGVSGTGTSMVLRNCVSTGNEAIEGGGVYCLDSEAELINCTVAGNSDGVCSKYYSSLTLTNCILWNPGEEISTVESNSLALFSCVEDGYAGTGNISETPYFVHPWDGERADLHLLANSPCIDAGTDIPSITTDIEGNSRPYGVRWDMGAYEYAPGYETPTPTETPTVEPTSTPTDTATPVLDTVSLFGMIKDFGQGNSPWDITGDGKIDHKDMFLFARNLSE